MNSLFGSGGPDIKLGKKGTLVIGGKPKKERKARDPNAPKRPLTAFFLYSASARPIVKQDLPETATSQEVSNEVLRRWNEMPISEKEVCILFKPFTSLSQHSISPFQNIQLQPPTF
jgi:HMG (high mobility group) box